MNESKGEWHCVAGEIHETGRVAGSQQRLLQTGLMGLGWRKPGAVRATEGSREGRKASLREQEGLPGPARQLPPRTPTLLAPVAHRLGKPRACCGQGLAQTVPPGPEDTPAAPPGTEPPRPRRQCLARGRGPSPVVVAAHLSNGHPHLFPGHPSPASSNAFI